MYMQNRNRLPDIENKLVVTKGKREVARDKLGVCNEHVLCGFMYFVFYFYNKKFLKIDLNV